MDLYKQYCTRKQALRLRELGVWNSCTKKDEDNYDIPVVGTFWSCETHEKIITGIIGEQEDAPYKMYDPVKHYSLAELLWICPGGVRVLRRGQCVEAYYIIYEDPDRIYNKSVTKRFTGCYDNPGEVVAEILIYLIAAGFTSVDVVNSKLLKEDPPPPKPTPDTSYQNLLDGIKY